MYAFLNTCKQSNNWLILIQNSLLIFEFADLKLFSIKRAIPTIPGSYVSVKYLTIVEPTTSFVYFPF